MSDAVATLDSDVEAECRRDVRAAERALYRAMIARDFTMLGDLLSPDLVYVHSTAVVETRDEYLAGVAQGRYEYESIESRDVTLRVRDNTAVMHGGVAMTVGVAGQSKEMTELLFVLVWTKQVGTWRLEYRQATRMGDRP